MRLGSFVLASLVLLPGALAAQRPDSLSETVQQYVALDTSAVALTHVARPGRHRRRADARTRRS